MTEDEAVALGDYCELLLAAPNFNLLCSTFEHDTMQQLLATKPHESEERERIFHTFNGLRTFVGHMLTLAQKARDLRPPEPVDPETTPVQEEPDSVVLDIYRNTDC